MRNSGKFEKALRFFSVLATLAAALVAASFSAEVHAADSIKGRQLYNANCAICHGPSGRSAMPGAPNFDRGEGMLKPDLILLSAIRTGRNAMPAYQGILTDRDIMDVIAFVRTLH